MKTRTTLLFPFLGIILCACTNPFTQFYVDGTRGVDPATLANRLEPFSNNPQIFTGSNDPMTDSQHMLEKGYTLLGYSDFNDSKNVTQKQMMDQATNVGADMVIFYSKFSHTETGVAAFPVFTPGTTSTTNSFGQSTANAYGTGGTATAQGTYSGTSTTQTPGTFSTSYVPYQRQVYEYGASFWRKSKPAILGAVVQPLPDTLRAQLQRNTGVVIIAVMNDSPAFLANLLRGDVIIGIGDNSVSTPEEFSNALQVNKGKKVVVTFIRDGKNESLEVQLN